MSSTYVIAAVDDMFFASKIRGTAEQVGVKVVFVRSVDAAMAAAQADPPSLVISDLHSQRIDPIALATQLRSHESLRSIRLLGFFSHVETELKQRAEAAGFSRVIARSVFSNSLAQILSENAG